MKLIWYYSVTIAFTLSMANVENEESNVFKSKSGRKIAKQVIDDFKVREHIPIDFELDLQEISEQNTFVHNGKVYSLHGEPLDVFTPEATYTHDGVPRAIPATNMLLIEDDDDLVTIAETALGEVETIMITNKRTGSADLLHSIAPGVLASVENTDKNAVKNVKERGTHLRRRVSQLLDDAVPTKRYNNKCSSYRQIDLAVAYDSSFCAQFNGNEAEANAHVFSIISMVSSKYQQEGLCVKVKVSHLESFCSPSVDPYKQYVDSKDTGCGVSNNLGIGVLGGLRQIWINERQNIHRDVVQLFIAETVDSSDACRSDGRCVRGCAQGKRSTCRPVFGYAFSQLTYAESIGRRVTIVAHELGHNNGAHHYDQLGYIMHSKVQELTVKGFSIDTINAFNHHFSQTSCIEAETAPYFPTSSPTSAPPTQTPLITDGQQITEPDSTPDDNEGGCYRGVKRLRNYINLLPSRLGQ